jgi:hypothetical protein
VGAVLGHDDLRFGYIDHLPGSIRRARFRQHVRRTPRAGLGVMVDNDVRVLDRTQGLPSMTFLST